MDEAPKKQAGIGRWILLGCVAVGGLGLLGFGGCAGLFYYLYSTTGDIAAVGAEYLRTAPEVRAKFGDELAVSRSWTNSRVNVTNDTGSAHFTYTVGGDKNRGDADVWLTKAGGRWTATGARVAPTDGSSSDLELGTVPPRR